MFSCNVFIWMMGLLMGFFPHDSVFASNLPVEPALTPTLEIGAIVTARKPQDEVQGSTEEAVITEGGQVEQESSSYRVRGPPVAETSENVELPSARLSTIQYLPEAITQGLLGYMEAHGLSDDELGGVKGVAK